MRSPFAKVFPQTVYLETVQRADKAFAEEVVSASCDTSDARRALKLTDDFEARP